MAFKEAKVKKLYGKNTGSWGGGGQGLNGHYQSLAANKFKITCFALKPHYKCFQSERENKQFKKC